MSKYANRQFWVDTFDRAVATFAQAFVGGIGADTIGLFDLDWAEAASIAGLAAFLSVLTTVAFRGGAKE